MADVIRTRVQPVVYIGIGGSGKEVLLALRRRFFESFNLRPSDLPSFIRFLAIDTDLATGLTTLKGASGFLTQAVEFTEKEKLCVPLSRDLTRSLEEEFEDKTHISNWLNQQLFEQAKMEVGAGAQQTRPLGRLAIFLHFDTLRQRLLEVLSEESGKAEESKKKGYDLFQRAEDKATRVYIIGSLSGGTGSGMALDLPYVIRSLMHTLNIEGIHGLFLLPDVYTQCEEKLTEARNRNNFIRVQANGYAALQEIEYFSRKGIQAIPAYLESPDPEASSFPWMRGAFPACWQKEDVARERVFEEPPYNKVMLVASSNEAARTLSERRDVIEMVADRLFLTYEVADAAAVLGSLDSNNVDKLLQSYTVGPSTFTRRYCTFGVAKYLLGTSILRNGVCLRLGQMALQDLVTGTLDPQAGGLSPKNVADYAKTALNRMGVDPHDQVAMEVILPKVKEAIAPEMATAESSPEGLAKLIGYLREADPDAGVLGKLWHDLEDKLLADHRERFVLPSPTGGQREAWRTALAERYWSNAYFGTTANNEARKAYLAKNPTGGATPGPEEIVLWLLDAVGAEQSARIVAKMSELLSREAASAAEAYEKKARGLAKRTDNAVARWADARLISPSILGTREEAIQLESGRARKTFAEEASYWLKAIACKMAHRFLNPEAGVTPNISGTVTEMVDLINKSKAVLVSVLAGKDGVDAKVVEFFRTGHASKRYHSPLLDKMREGDDQTILRSATKLLYYALFAAEGQDLESFQPTDAQRKKMQKLVMYVRQIWFKNMCEAHSPQLMPLDLAFKEKRLTDEAMIEALHRTCYEIPWLKNEELMVNGRECAEFQRLRRDDFLGKSAAEFLIAEENARTLMNELPDLAKPYGSLDMALSENLKKDCGGTALLILKRPPQGADRLRPLEEKFRNIREAFLATDVDARSGDAVTLVYERMAIPLPALKQIQDLQKWHRAGLDGGNLYIFKDATGARFSAVVPDITPPLGAMADQRRKAMENSLLGILTGVIYWNEELGEFRYAVSSRAGRETVGLGPGLGDVVRAVSGMTRLNVEPELLFRSLDDSVFEARRNLSPEGRIALVALLRYVQKHFCPRGASDRKEKDHNILWSEIIDSALAYLRTGLVATIGQKAMEDALQNIVCPWLDCFFEFVGPKEDERHNHLFRQLPTLRARIQPEVMKRNRRLHLHFLAPLHGKRSLEEIMKYTNLAPDRDGNMEVPSEVLKAWEAAPEDISRIPAEVRAFVERAAARST